ncbi:MAG: hypothetical protein K6C94_09020 [Candidatus Gastranaerophilales bacterium]|nr:hypothetical protein [Candidatus Gastranaerophilales bacterium]
MTERYNWVDNPTVSQVSEYNPDILNECLMHLKYNNLPPKTDIFTVNSGNVDADGNADLIEAQIADEFIRSAPGTYTLTIGQDGYYDVVAIGGGAGGAVGMNVYSVKSTSSGGSGAAFAGKIYIPAGTYTCTVGAGGSAAGNGGYGGGGGATSIGDLISAGGGTQGAYATWDNRVQSFGGTVTVNTTIDSSTLNSNGNNGSVAFNADSAGGASLYRGYGKGGDAGCYGAYNGSNGFLSVKFQGGSFINYKIGGNYPAVTATLPDGEKITVTGLNSDDAQYLSNGTYNKFIGTDGSEELLKNNIYRQAKPPVPSTNDVWFDTSSEPCRVLKYNGSNWEEYNKIPLCSMDISNCNVTGCKTFPYNQNGYNTNSKSPSGKPSGVYCDLTLPASNGTVIAKYNGYIQLSAYSASYLQMYNLSKNSFWTAVNNQNNGEASISIPCSKGDEIKVYYGIANFRWFRCYADEGAV